MIIDFHAHTFPDNLAPRALAQLSGDEGLTPFTEGTNAGLLQSMEQGKVDISVLLPVATNPEQTASINRRAIEIHRIFDGHHGLCSFGGIHPGNSDYIEIIKELSMEGVKGIKLHPVFQRTYLDDITYLRIIDFACSLGMLISIHGGFDISCAGAEHAAPAHLLTMLKELRPENLIIAHMGCWREWNLAEQVLNEIASLGLSSVYVDTSFVLSPDERSCFYNTGIPAATDEQFRRLVDILGVDHVLFGTDTPWTDQAQSIAAIRRSITSFEEQADILGRNAVRLLGLI